MTCSKSKTLMLMRNDEMTNREAEGLRRHLAGCRECAAHMQESKSVFLRLKALRSFEPALENAEGLAADILNSVERARQTRGRRLNIFPVHVFEFLSGRAARIAYGVFVLASVGMFLIQQLGVATSVQSLEKKMVQRGENGTGIRVVYTVPSSLVNRLPQSEQMRSYIGREKTEQQDGNLIIDGRGLSRVAGLVGSAIFRSGNVLAGEESRKNFESIVEALRQSVSARVTIRSKERL